jgi:hypothetical protein
VAALASLGTAAVSKERRRKGKGQQKDDNAEGSADTDNGERQATTAGTYNTKWCTLLQKSEHAQRLTMQPRDSHCQIKVQAYSSQSHLQEQLTAPVQLPTTAAALAVSHVLALHIHPLGLFAVASLT